MKNPIKILCLAALFGTYSYARAETSVWLTSGMQSYHEDRSRGYRENNNGIGLEWQLNKKYTLVAGEYQNSLYQKADYIGYRWTPWHAAGFSAGFTTILITGYTYDCHTVGTHDKYCTPANRPALAPVPTITYEYKSIGLNIFVVPTIVTAVQLRIKF